MRWIISLLCWERVVRARLLILVEVNPRRLWSRTAWMLSDGVQSETRCAPSVRAQFNSPLDGQTLRYRALQADQLRGHSYFPNLLSVLSRSVSALVTFRAPPP